MADQLESILCHRCNIYEPTEAADSKKNSIVGFTQRGWNVSCRVKPIKPDSKQEIGGLITDSTHKGYFLPTIPVRLAEGWRIVVSGDQYVAGYYDVRGVGASFDATEIHHLTVQLKSHTEL